MHPLQEIKMDLKEFWAHFQPCGRGSRQGKCFGKCQPREFKLQLLSKYSEKRYGFNKRIPLADRRKQFLRAPYFRDKRDSPCWACLQPAEARHHIIELQHGGTNAKKNVIPICRNCHAEIHPWLKENHTLAPRSGGPSAGYKSTATA